MNAGQNALAALVVTSVLSACATSLPAGTTSVRPLTASGHAANGLAYSAAPADTVQTMPASGACRYRGTGLFAQPDPHCAPGALNPAVTPATLERTICRAGGYTGSVRPPDSVTEPEKRELMAAYGNTTPPSHVELDHVVSLSLGGAPNDPANLYPEPNYPGVPSDTYYHNPKDRLEQRLHQLTCQGRLPLARAQAALAHNWPAAYRRYVRSGEASRRARPFPSFGHSRCGTRYAHAKREDEPDGQ